MRHNNAFQRTHRRATFSLTGAAPSAGVAPLNLAVIHPQNLRCVFMKKRIYSCARAHFVRPNESLEDSWHWITSMFDKSREGMIKSFIPGGHRLEPFANENNGGLRAGKIFKLVERYIGGEYVIITQWKPFNTLTYIETWEPDPDADPNRSRAESQPTIMKFRLEEHHEGTRVFIERVEVGVFNIGFRERIFGHGSKFDENTSVGRLGFILTENRFPKGMSYKDSMYTIERVDSIRNLQAW